MHDLSTGTFLTRYTLRGALCEPMTAMTMGAMVIGGALSASSTLAGGNTAAMVGSAQKSAAESAALQMTDNAAQSFASGQRKALDTGYKTRQLVSSSVARAGASGVDPSVGSPIANVGEIAQRGSYHAMMDLFNGESEATGLRNQAEATRFSGNLAELEGEQKKSASRLAAAGTLAGSAGSAFSTYGKFTYPTSRGSFGA